jgi:glycerol-3-phosphate dehydrogenase
MGPHPTSTPALRNMSHKTPATGKLDPRYGQVICRCENITEGEIIAEIHHLYCAHLEQSNGAHGLVPDAARGLRYAPCGEYPLERVRISPLRDQRGKGSDFLFRETKEVESKMALKIIMVFGCWQGLGGSCRN